MKKVITYGTFDLFHKGHYNILKRAKDHGDYLIVGITGETYDIGRGKLNVHDTLATRIENVKKTGFADEIIIEEYLGQKIGDIIKYDIDTFVIGDDWKGKFDHLSRYCEMIYLERTKGISSSQIREKRFNQYDIGIVCDIPDDNQLIKESNFVNGFVVKNVFCESKKNLEIFQDKYHVENTFDSYEKMLDASDIIFVRCAIEKRYEYIFQALSKGKHVLYDPPATFNSKELKNLIELAKQNKVILLGNIKMLYIYIFNQLLWMTQSGLIGDILSFNCYVSKDNPKRHSLFYELSTSSILIMLKVMGQDYDKADFQINKNGNKMEFASMNFVYPKGRAIISVGDNVRVDNQLEIIGTEGTILMKGAWWRSKNFELHTPGSDEVQLFNTNFEGNGFRYLLKTMSSMLTHNKITSKEIFEEESMKLIEILNQLNKVVSDE